MGHIISKEGVVINERKIEAMTYWPTLRTLKELIPWSHGVLAKMCDKACANCEGINESTQKRVFSWNLDANTIFQVLGFLFLIPQAYECYSISTGRILGRLCVKKI